MRSKIITITIVIVLFVLLSIYLFWSNKTNNNNFNNINISTANTSVKTDLMYNLYKDLISCDELLSYEKIDIPNTIDEKNTAMLGIYDTNNVLMLLYHEKPVTIISEIGIFNFELQEYNKLFDVENNTSVKICDYNTQYIVLQEIDSNSLDVILKIFDCIQKNMVTIHKYNTEYLNSSISTSNKVTLNNNKVYFDDIVSKGENTEVSLYCTELKDMTTFKIRKETQNPMCFNDDIIYIGKSNGKKYDTLYSLDEKYISKLPSNTKDIYSEGTNIFSININTDFEMKKTTWQVTDIIKNTELLVTNEAIDSILCNEYYMSWNNFKYEIPILYSIKSDKFLAFNDIEKGYNLFFLYESSGILMNYNDHGNHNYYYFKTK